PGSRLTNEKYPFWSVAIVRLAAVPEFISTTVAPFTTSPDASLTVPTIVPNVDCPSDGVLQASSVATAAVTNSRCRRRFHKLFVSVRILERTRIPSPPSLTSEEPRHTKARYTKWTHTTARPGTPNSRAAKQHQAASFWGPDLALRGAGLPIDQHDGVF